jgi:hypothetical protein
MLRTDHQGQSRRSPGSLMAWCGEHWHETEFKKARIYQQRR